MLAVPHEVMPTTQHASALATLRVGMSAAPHVDILARPHLGSARMIKCIPVRLRSCAHSSFPHKPTSQQESMRT